MSLALIQSYSSAEDEEENPRTAAAEDYRFSDEEGEEEHEENDTSSGIRGAEPRYLSYKSVYYDSSVASNSASGLPSAFDAFSKISAPPQFLNKSVEEKVAGRDVGHQQPRHGRWKARKVNNELPSGAVLESKAQLVGIHERVRSDIQSSQSQALSGASTTDGEGKRVAGAANPSAEDAAELLRMCLQCGIPKTYSSGRGMTCPVCGDRPPNDASQVDKRKGSAVKDKEKSKRMKGQSSHATWKSETEMALRQQFD